MNAETPSKVRVELHVHTRYSKDSLVDIKRLLDHCRKIGIDRIAITDHNEIDGALAAFKMDPERVIVGEEIETTQGELLGYFMQERIPPGLEPEEVVRRLRVQGAVISAAHPFDTIRSFHWGWDELSSIAPLLDAVEVYNARCLKQEPNRQAAVFARDHDLFSTVGSDAHSLMEVGKATLLMSPFKDSDEFIAALQSAEIEARLSPAFVHLFSRYAVISKKIRKQ